MGAMRRLWVCYSLVCAALIVLGLVKVGALFALVVTIQAVVQMIPAIFLMRLR